MSKIKSYKYLTINSLLNRLVTDEDVFQELERIGRVDFNKMHSIFQAVDDKYYGLAIEVESDVSYQTNTIIEYYNVDNCNFVISHQEESVFYATRACWCGNYPTNIKPDFLSPFLLDLYELHIFCCNNNIDTYIKLKADNTCDSSIVSAESVLKTKMLSLKYGDYLPGEFWTDILDDDGYGEFLVENLFKRIKDEVSI